MPEGHGNVGEIADFRFHPSRPSGLGHLIWRKALAYQRKLVHEAARTAIHLGNPGLGCFAHDRRDQPVELGFGAGLGLV
jgi:hypothetical protein